MSFEVSQKGLKGTGTAPSAGASGTEVSQKGLKEFVSI